MKIPPCFLVSRVQQAPPADRAAMISAGRLFARTADARVPHFIPADESGFPGSAMIGLLGGQYHENGDSRRPRFSSAGKSVASAQVGVTIDTRSVHITRGTGESRTSAGVKAQQLAFTLLDTRQIAVGEVFDFELAITNRSDEKRKRAPW